MDGHLVFDLIASSLWDTYVPNFINRKGISDERNRF
jgi:hypothetical protein